MVLHLNASWKHDEKAEPPLKIMLSRSKHCFGTYQVRIMPMYIGLPFSCFLPPLSTRTSKKHGEGPVMGHKQDQLIDLGRRVKEKFCKVAAGGSVHQLSGAT